MACSWRQSFSSIQDLEPTLTARQRQRQRRVRARKSRSQSVEEQWRSSEAKLLELQPDGLEPGHMPVWVNCSSLKHSFHLYTSSCFLPLSSFVEMLLSVSSRTWLLATLRRS